MKAFGADEPSEAKRRAEAYPRLVAMLKDLRPHITDAAWAHVSALLEELEEQS